MMPINSDIAAGDAVIRFHQRKQRSRRALLPCERVMQVMLGVVRPDDGMIHVRAGNLDPRDEIVVLCQTRRKVCARPDVDFRRLLRQFQRHLRCAWKTRRIEHLTQSASVFLRVRCLRRFLAFELNAQVVIFCRAPIHFRVLPDERAEQHCRARHSHCRRKKS